MKTLDEKRCSACKGVKPLDDFYTTGRPGERTAACKECVLARVASKKQRRQEGTEDLVIKAFQDDLIYGPDEFEFLKAVEAYKRDNRRPFPSWTEILWLLKSLGWKKT